MSTPADQPLAEPLYPTSGIAFLDGGMVLRAGENSFAQPMVVGQPLKRGLTVAVALSGGMRCTIDARPALVIAAPNVSLIVCDAAHRREQVYEAGTRLRYVIVHLAPEPIETLFGVAFAEVVAVGRRLDGGRDPAFVIRPADETIRAVATRILGCPMTGLARDVYLMGKGLELAALAIEQFLPSMASSRLPRAPETARLEAARAVLIADVRSPPNVGELALKVGLNPRKLNDGFRAAFGMTPHAFLQEYRLQLAFQKIAAEHLSVAEVAYLVGYTPAHFTTIFRRRFGLSPSELR